MRAVPAWMMDNLGRMVTLSQPCEDYPAGKAGVLLSVRSMAHHGVPNVYATVAFNFADLTDEDNVPLHALAPWQALTST